MESKIKVLGQENIYIMVLNLQKLPLANRSCSCDESKGEKKMGGSEAEIRKEEAGGLGGEKGGKEGREKEEGWKEGRRDGV